MTKRLADLSGRTNVIAQAAIVLAERKGCGLYDALVACAKEAGVRPSSDEFDEAALLAGLPYCRALDLYVDSETKCRAEELGFNLAHLALC